MRSRVNQSVDPVRTARPHCATTTSNGDERAGTAAELREIRVRDEIRAPPRVRNGRERRTGGVGARRVVGGGGAGAVGARGVWDRSVRRRVRVRRRDDDEGTRVHRERVRGRWRRGDDDWGSHARGPGESVDDEKAAIDSRETTRGRRDGGDGRSGRRGVGWTADSRASVDERVRGGGTDWGGAAAAIGEDGVEEDEELEEASEEEEDEEGGDGEGERDFNGGTRGARRRGVGRAEVAVIRDGE